jgi:hypothetical protein
MFVKVGDHRELGLSAIKEVQTCNGGSTIVTNDSESFACPHPAEEVRKALTVYTGLLSGREEGHVPFPSFPLLKDPQSITGLRLDLTKEQIEITEETIPVDADGNIQLDATQSRVRTLSYNGDRERAAARKQAEVEARKKPQIGQTIAGKGVYMGAWTPKDRSGNSLGKSFAVYAASEDLTDESGKKLVATFQDTAKRMTGLRNWHGHDGGNFANDTALYQGLADGSAICKWFIPTRDLLVGTDLNGNKVQADNLYAHKDKGDLMGTFTMSGGGVMMAMASDPRRGFVCYWSCTELRDAQSYVWNARLSDGDNDWNLKANCRLSCRPCRVEAVSHLVI